MRHRYRLRASLTAVVLLVTGGATAVSEAPAQATTCTVAAAGDVAGADDVTKAVATGDLIERRNPVKVFALGDLAYDNGSVTDFQQYHKAWGAFTAKTAAVPGNHEGSGTAGITGELGASAVANRGVSVCGWRVVLINMYGHSVSSGASFIAAQRAAYPGVPMAVVWHAPWRTSGSEHGTSANATVAPLWRAAVAAHARMVLSGHDHDGEVFKPMDASGNATANGVQQIVSGKGGHHPRPFGTIRANSIASSRVSGSDGAPLFLTLRTDGSYDWAFVAPSGTVRASGTRAAAAGTTPVPSPSPSPTTTGGTPLSYSTHSDRSAAVVLSPATTPTVKGLAYFFTPTSATTKATFRIDGGTTITESVPAFDARATAADGTAKPLDTTKLANGRHTITANSVSPDRPATTYSFTVAN